MNTLLEKISRKKGQIALLIDPEKTHSSDHIDTLLHKAGFAGVDYIFIGGSTVARKELEQCVRNVKQKTTIPVLLFPGSSSQLSEDADGLLFLNLLSGRNPDFLIGHQVACAEEVFDMNLEVIPTSYLLIDGGKMSSVAYVSQTTPIPRDQHNIAVKTSIAGYLMGQQLTFLDAGSGALNAVPVELVRKISSKLPTPIIVGGGIRDTETITAFARAGANIIVIGNKIEEEVDFLLDLANYQQNTHKTR